MVLRKVLQSALDARDTTRRGYDTVVLFFQNLQLSFTILRHKHAAQWSPQCGFRYTLLRAIPVLHLQEKKNSSRRTAPFEFPRLEGAVQRL